MSIKYLILQLCLLCCNVGSSFKKKIRVKLFSNRRVQFLVSKMTVLCRSSTTLRKSACCLKQDIFCPSGRLTGMIFSLDKDKLKTCREGKAYTLPATAGGALELFDWDTCLATSNMAARLSSSLQNLSDLVHSN